tara:strand:- start:377 stop:766 length:390 start_codon:yes stop_codon:yes gene_type:complete
MIENLPNYFTSAVLGVMLFFSFVVAPITFTVLDEVNSRKFIRKIFPYYYLSNLFLCLCALISLVILDNINFDFYLILAITILFVISNFILMPLINKFRDNKEDKKFKYSHSVSVLINFIQLIILVIILI